MAERISHSFENSAFLGKEGRNEAFKKKVDVAANYIYRNNVLVNPQTKEEKDEQRSKAGELVKTLGGKDSFNVESVKGLMEMKDDVNKSESQKNIAEERLDVLGKSVYWVMKNGKDSQLQDLLGRGSAVEIDRMLPEPLKGLGERVVENIISNGEILGKLKELDDIRENCDMKNPADRQIMLEEITQAYTDLTKIKGLSPEEKKQLYMVKAYLNTEIQGLNGENIRVVNKNFRDGTRDLPPDVILGKPNENGEREWGMRSYDMTRDRLAELEWKQKDPSWFPSRPPEWYSDLTKEDRDIVDIRIKLLEAAAAKFETRNKLPVEKLRGIKPEIKGKEFSLLWEKMPGFKEAMSVIVKDLCQTYTDPNDPEKKIFLRLKNTNGLMDQSVYDWLSNFDSFRNHVSNKVAETLGHKKVGMKDIEAVSTAWNFIFLGDVIESWDYFRQLKPSDVVSDKLRTTYHLRSKFLGKNGIYKVSGISDENWGEEEPFISNQLFQWVAHNLDADKAGFSQRVLNGDLKDIVPDTMAVSMIELMPAKYTDKDGKIRETSMALALMGKDQCGNEVELNKIVSVSKNDLNIMQPHSDMVQGADWISQAIKGDQPLDMSKNLDAWAKNFVECTGLTRQEPMIPREGIEKRDNFGKLSFPDKPMFYWSILINSIGFNSTDKFPLLDIKKLVSNSQMAVASNYDLAIRDLLDVIAVRSKVDKKKVKELLGAANMLDYSRKKMINDKNRLKSLHFL